MITVQLATGRIRNYQLAVGGMQLMNFPLSYLCLQMGLQPESTFIVAIVISLLCLMLRLVFLRKMVDLPVRSFIYNVCSKALLVLVVASIVPCWIHFHLQYGVLRFLTVLMVCLICVSLTAYFIGCNVAERRFICDKVALIKSKILQ